MVWESYPSRTLEVAPPRPARPPPKTDPQSYGQDSRAGTCMDVLIYHDGLFAPALLKHCFFFVLLFQGVRIVEHNVNHLVYLNLSPKRMHTHLNIHARRCAI